MVQLDLIDIRWHTGAVTQLKISRSLSRTTKKKTIEFIKEMSNKMTDGEIAQELNRHNNFTARGKRWTGARVKQIRFLPRIKTDCPSNPMRREEVARGDGLFPVKSAAKMLGVTGATVRNWIKAGLLEAKQQTSRGAFWVKINAGDREKIYSSPPGKEWMTIKEATQKLGCAYSTLRYYIRKGKVKSKIMRRGMKKTWYVAVNDPISQKNCHQLLRQSKEVYYEILKINGPSYRIKDKLKKVVKEQNPC